MKKITVVGAGNVGAQCIYRLAQKGFENLVRWAHLGDSIRSGIILVDFEHNGRPTLGNATNFAQVQDTLEHIAALGIDRTKKIYLTNNTNPLAKGLALGFMALCIIYPLQAFFGPYFEIRTISFYFWAVAGIVISYKKIN